MNPGMKDVRLILDAAGEVQVPLPFASIVRDKCLAAQAHGLGQRGRIRQAVRSASLVVKVQHKN